MAKKVNDKTILEVITLSKLLGEFGSIQRAVYLPSGELETDSHHSFALALIAYELAKQYAPELDSSKIMLYGLVHDLTELITGDTVTLTASAEELQEKSKRELQALPSLRRLLKDAPHVLSAAETYEANKDQEALFVYWIDKMITIPTHFYDHGANLRALGIKNRQDISKWYERTLEKLQKQQLTPHTSAVQILELAYQKMREELFES